MPYDANSVTLQFFMDTHRERKQGADAFRIRSCVLYRWKDDVFIVDDNFIGNKALLKKEFCLQLDNGWNEKASIGLNTEALSTFPTMRADAHEVKAGFNTVFVGIESPNEEVDWV